MLDSGSCAVYTQTGPRQRFHSNFKSLLRDNWSRVQSPLTCLEAGFYLLKANGFVTDKALIHGKVSNSPELPDTHPLLRAHGVHTATGWPSCTRSR